jgi:hypothetical protein
VRVDRKAAGELVDLGQAALLSQFGTGIHHAGPGRVDMEMRGRVLASWVMRGRAASGDRSACVRRSTAKLTDGAKLGNVVDRARRRRPNGADHHEGQLLGAAQTSVSRRRRPVRLGRRTKPLATSSSMACRSTSPRNAIPSALVTLRARKRWPKMDAAFAPMLEKSRPHQPSGSLVRRV